MNKFFRITSVIMSAMLIAVLLTAGISAATTTVEIGNIEVPAEATTVKVPVNIKDNQGIIRVSAMVTYDESLTLTSVEAGDLGLESYSSDQAEDLAKNPYKIYFSAGAAIEDVTGNGVIAYLNFTLPQDAAVGTKYTISVSDGEAYNAALSTVSLAYTAGTITVRGETQLGDIDGDGSVDTEDDIALARYLAGWLEASEINVAVADLNSDGIVDPSDRIVLNRHVSDWAGYETLPLS